MPASIGTARYGPALRNGSTVRRDGGTTEWWLILDCDPDLGRFFRHLYSVAAYRTRTVQPPLWGPHVSVIRGEVPPNREAWRKAAGEAVEFEYDQDVRETDGYLWVPVRCPAMLAHREELGLPRDPDPPLHLTIGNLRHE